MVAKKSPPKKKPAAKKPIPKVAPHPATEAAEAQTEESAEVEQTEAETEEFKLPRGISQEEYDTAHGIIVDGFANDADPDTIKGAMFENGIPFSKLVRLYSLITTQERLVIPPGEVRDTLKTWFEENAPELENLASSYSVVDQLAKFLCKEVEGCTPRNAMTAIKNYMEENGVDVPKKPAGMGRTSAVAKTIVNGFAENSEMTFEEYKEMLTPLTTEKSINRWLGLYKVFSLIAANDPFPG